jgi:hypothetical protein
MAQVADEDTGLAEFLDAMDSCTPTVKRLSYCFHLLNSFVQIPEELTKYYLSRSGFVTEDPRL